jgi:hypothetical protein
MSKQPLDYQVPTVGDDPVPKLRWQTVVSCSLLGMALVCGVGAVVWWQRRSELIAAAISLGVTGVIIYFPYVRT